MKKIFILIALSNIFFNNAYAEIALTNNYKTIQKIIKKADKDSLVLFDIADVLIMPTNEYSLKHPYRKKLVKKYEEKIGEQESKKLWSNVLKIRKIKYVDPVIPEIFSDLSKRNIPTMGLTKCFTGTFGTMKNSEDWRISELKSMNIHFDKLSPLKSKVEFSDIIPKNGIPSSTPMLKNGIIFSARADKGTILERVFKHYNFYPKKIIFIDDKYKNLESVEKISKKYNIEFTGYIITAAHNLPKESLDMAKEEKRFEILEKESRWVVD